MIKKRFVMLIAVLVLSICLTMAFGITAYADGEEIVSETVAASVIEEVAAAAENAEQNTPASEATSEIIPEEVLPVGQDGNSEDGTVEDESLNQTEIVEPAQGPELTDEEEPVNQESENPAEESLNPVITADFTGKDGAAYSLTLGESVGLEELVANLGYEGEITSFVSSNPEALDVEEGKLVFKSGFGDETITLVINGAEVVIPVHDPTTLEVSTPQGISTAFGSANSGDTVKLTADITISSTLNVTSGKNFTLDLNGHVLKASINSGDNRSVILMNGGTLTIIDSDPTATHTGTYASLPAGGVITGGKGTNHETGNNRDGGGICVLGGNLIMKAGTIYGNEVTDDGGGVFVAEGASFTMTGGTITGNKVTGTQSGNRGGGVCFDGTVSVGGSATITGNTQNNGSTPSNLYVRNDDQKVVVINNADVPTTMNIGIKVASNPTGTNKVDVSGNNSKNYSGYFTSDDSNYIIVNSNSGNKVQLMRHSHSWRYSASGATVTATCNTSGCPITDKTLTIQASNVAYDGSEHGATFAQTSFLGSNTLPTITYYKKGTGGNYTQISGTPKDAGDYEARFVPTGGSWTTTTHYGFVRFTISKAEITVSGITADNKIYNGNTAATLKYDGVVLTGLVDGETLAVTATGTFEDKNVGEDKIVTISNIQITSNQYSKNYVLAGSGQQTSAQADITAKQLTVSGITAENKTYDGTTDATLVYTGVIFGGIVDGEELALTATGTFADKDAGTSKTVNITGLTLTDVSGKDFAKNYVLASTGQQETTTADIAQAKLTVTDATVSDKTYDGTPTTTATVKAVDGMVPGDNIAVNAAAEFEDAEIGDDKPVTVTYSLSGADAGNYYLDPAVDSTSFKASIKPAPAPQPAPDPAPAKTLVDTTDTGETALVTFSGSSAYIYVVNKEGEVIDPVNVRILDPAELIARGGKTAEIRMTDNLLVIIDVEASMRGNSIITIDNLDGIIIVKCGGVQIFSADLTDIIDSVAKLVYDGASLKAFDEGGNLIKEFEI